MAFNKKLPVLLFFTLFTLLVTVFSAWAACVDSDGFDLTTASMTTVDGEVFYDSCSNFNTVQEYTCDAGELKQGGHHCELGCSEGACIQEEDTVIDCTDSDGFDVMTVGHVTDLNGVEHHDFCDSEKIAADYTCDNVDRAKVNYKRCAHQCVDGRCISDEEAAHFCTDPDGRDPFVRTTSQDEYGKEKTDYCDDRHWLYEYVCEDGSLTKERIDCTADCQWGACRIPNIAQRHCEDFGQIICYDGWIETCVEGVWKYTDCPGACGENGCLLPEPEVEEPAPVVSTPAPKPTPQPTPEPVVEEPMKEEPAPEPVPKPVMEEPVEEEPTPEPVMEEEKVMEEPQVVRKSILNRFFHWVNVKLFG